MSKSLDIHLQFKHRLFTRGAQLAQQRHRFISETKITTGTFLIHSATRTFMRSTNRSASSIHGTEFPASECQGVWFYNSSMSWSHRFSGRAKARPQGLFECETRRHEVAIALHSISDPQDCLFASSLKYFPTFLLYFFPVGVPCARWGSIRPT